MKSKTSINPSAYINMSTIEAIHKHLNIPLGRGGLDHVRNGFQADGNQDDDEIQGEIIDEEVVDEYDD